jgi:thiol-disulfide isomerase/thioredoxin
MALGGCTKKPITQPQAKEPVPEPTAIAAEKTEPTIKPAADTTTQEAAKPVAVMPTKMGDAAWPLDGLEFVKGGPVKIEPGKAYIVEFWATWCPPCKVTIPHLTEVAHKYKDKKVVVVGISTEKIDLVKGFVTKQAEKMDYNVAVDSAGKVSRGYMGAFGVNTIPHAFIVDLQGKLAWYGHPMDDMERVLDGVLAGTFDSGAYASARAEEQAKYAANQETYRAYFEKIDSGATLQEARAVVEKWIDQAPAEMLNGLSWEILTELEENRRDKELAMKAAEKANTMTEGKNASILDTYALALFQNGKTTEAIAAQEKAMELVKGDAAAEADIQERLTMYKAAASSKQ